MPPLLIYIGGFIACAALIIYSGARVSKYGDLIADITGISKAWFGLIVMGAVTSLPELFTGVSSILIFDTPDIAVGDIMGSLTYNLLILAVLDYFIPRKPLSSVVTKSHLLAIFCGISLITVSIIDIVFGSKLLIFGWFSSSTLIILVFYVFSMQLIFKNEHRRSHKAPAKNPKTENETIKNTPLRWAVKKYVLNALLVITGALLLPYFADRLATASGLSATFVGTLLVAATTSLPELVVSMAAIRLGSMDIAVGNLVGSNLFNMLILAIDDLIYVKGPLLHSVNPGHGLSALIALLMTAVAGISIFYSASSKRFVLGIDAVVLIVLYTMLMLGLYRLG